MVKRAVRNDFTESDDHHLTQYIAQVKPNNSGRLGNNLYILLENSVDQRPWAKRHSWQSWRERYKKNQDWFNHQIKKYQKQVREATRQRREENEKENADEEVREELYNELFGTSHSSEEDDDEPDAHEKSSPPSSPSKENIYPSIENIPLPETVDKEPRIPGSFDGGVETEAVSNLLPTQKPTPQSVTSSGQKSTTARPTSVLQPPRSPQHVHHKPKRRVLPGEDDGNFFGTPSPSPSLPATNATAKRKLPILREGPYRNSLKRPRAVSGDDTNDESWPPKRRKKVVETTPRTGSAEKLSQLRPPAGPKPVSTDAVAVPKAEHDERIAISGSQDSVPIKPVHRLAPGDGAQATLQPPCIFPEDYDDPFIVKKLSNTEKTDITPPVSNFKLPPRRIDLRESLNARRRSRTISTRVSPSSTTSHSITPFLAEDQELINRVGFHQVMAVIAKHYGFDVDVAKKAFLKTRSIEKTESLLQCVKEAACSATSDWLAKRGDVDSSSPEPVDPSSPEPIDHHRIFFKRISEHRSALNEDEDDPAMVKLAQEHRDLVMNVTEENADALRSFEGKNNQDLLRLWSLDWVKQKVADM